MRPQESTDATCTASEAGIAERCGRRTITTDIGEPEGRNVKDSTAQKVARQYTEAILNIDRLRAAYEPRSIDCLGRIATALVQLYELFEHYEPNLERMTAGELARTNSTGSDVAGRAPLRPAQLQTIYQVLTRQRAYFRSSVFTDHVCLVLGKRENQCWTYYGYSRRKLLKFLRGETLHAHTTIQLGHDLSTLRDFVYETPSQTRPVFAIRRDFIQFPNIILEEENDTRNAYDEPITLPSGEIYSLTTIESIVFSICNEHANVLTAGQMGWNKSCLAFRPTQYSSLLPETIADSIIAQSACWNGWNAFTIVD